jgi:predicted dehydrogenase
VTAASPSAAPLTAILAGLGGLGEAWLPALTGPGAAALGVTLTAVCEPDAPRAAAALARRGLALPVHERLWDALAARPAIVVDCTTPNARLAIAREALLAGAHVLCVGPLAADEETAARLIGASARAPGHLAVAHEARHQPGLRQLRDLVRSGALGRPQTLRAELHAPPGADAGQAAMRHAMLRGPAIEAFDAARAILGADALSVACDARTPEGQPFAHAPEAHARFGMADGALFLFSGNRAEAGPPSSPHGMWRLTLSGGMARWDGAGPAEAWTLSPGSAPHPLPPPAALPDVPASLAGLVAAIRAGRRPETHVRDAAASLAMVLAAIRSADRDGRPEAVRRLGDLSDASGLSATGLASPRQPQEA